MKRNLTQVPYRRGRGDEGLTFVEMLITIVLLGAITGAIVVAFSTSIRANSAANDRVKKSNDAQAIATFLQRDAASAGGYDERNALLSNDPVTGPAPGVDVGFGSTTNICDQANSIVRFEWIERAVVNSQTRVVANYTLNNGALTRTYCSQVLPAGPVEQTSAALGRQIASADAVCSPACSPASRLPSTVQLNLTTTNGPGGTAPYQFSVSGFVRTGGASATTNPQTVPLITLGIPQGTTPCPTMPNATTTGSSFAVSSTDGSNVMVDGVAAINARGTSTCGQPISLPGPYNGASRLNATQTLIQEGVSCPNCGPTIVSGAVPDPYAGVLTPPAYNASACNSTSPGQNPTVTHTGDRHIHSPGVYPRTLVLAEYGPARYEFNPGIYIFCRGINVFSGTVVTNAPNSAGGVLFYFHGGSIRRIGNSPDGDYVNDFQYNDMQWILEGRSEYRNVVIWQPNPTRPGASNPANNQAPSVATGDLQLGAGDNQHDGSVDEEQNAPYKSNFKGIIYAPNAQVEFFFPLELFASVSRNYMRSHGQVPVAATVTGIVARNVAVGSAAAIRVGAGPQTTTSLSANPNPSNVGDPVTLRAVVAPVAPATGTPTGSVAFYDNNEQLGSANLVNGVAEVVSTTIGGGNRELQAIYSGDGVFASSLSPIINQTGNAGSSNTVVSTSANPSGEGQALTIRANVSGAGPTATGNVQFSINGVDAGTYPLVGGVASFVNTTLPQGTHTITAQYLGSSTYNPSSGSMSQRVLEGSITVLTSSPNPSTPGASVTLVATVGTTAGTSPAGGTVTFLDGAANVGTATVTGSGPYTATLTTNALVTPGAHTLTANYNGNAQLAPSSGTRSHTVGRANSAVALTSTPNPSSQGANVTFTATVSPNPAGAGTPTGTVTFFDGNNQLGQPQAINGAGVATISTTNLSLGNHNMRAQYNGDANFNGATSATHVHNVSGIAVDVTLTRTTGGGTVDPGEQVDFEVEVERVGQGSDPTSGGVRLYDNDVEIGFVSNIGSDSTANFDNRTFGPGTHVLRAEYNGSGSFAPGTSNTLTFTVGRYPTSVALESGNNPSGSGEPVTFTATVNESGPGSATGTMSLRRNGTTIDTVNVMNGVATFTTTFPSTGSFTMSAVYSGDDNFAGSTSGNLTQTVRRLSATVVSTSPNPSNNGADVDITATVSRTEGGSTPSGTVEFFIDGASIGTRTLGNSSSGSATVTFQDYDDMSGGPHVITARYLGNTTFGPSDSPNHTHTVNRIATSTSWVTNGSLATGSSPVIAGQNVRLTVRVTSGGAGINGGTVTFLDNGSPIGTFNTSTQGGQSGVATMVANFSTTGTHQLTATFNGTGTYNVSTSPTLNMVVNPPPPPSPVINSIAPSSIAKGSNNVTVTLSGSNFQNTSSVVVSYPSPGTFCFNANSGVSVPAAVAVNPTGTQITFTINVANNASGSTLCSRSRTVTVTTPGGTDTITFNVTG